MRIKMNYRLNYLEADKLIEKYYDGLTTFAEERQLQRFLEQADLPEKYQVERDIFGFYEHKKVRKQVTLRPYLRWVAVAAVVLMVVAGPQLFIPAHSSDYAYIDGRKISDIREVRSQALVSLEDISATKDEVQESFKNINDTRLMEQQLEVFSK